MYDGVLPSRLLQKIPRTCVLEGCVLARRCALGVGAPGRCACNNAAGSCASRDGCVGGVSCASSNANGCEDAPASQHRSSCSCAVCCVCPMLKSRRSPQPVRAPARCSAPTSAPAREPPRGVGLSDPPPHPGVGNNTRSRSAAGPILRSTTIRSRTELTWHKRDREGRAAAGTFRFGRPASGRPRQDRRSIPHLERPPRVDRQFPRCPAHPIGPRHAVPTAPLCHSLPQPGARSDAPQPPSCQGTHRTPSPTPQ